jgi:hypothetical protein
MERGSAQDGRRAPHRDDLKSFRVEWEPALSHVCIAEQWCPNLHA